MKKFVMLIVAAFMLTANTVSAQEQQVPNIPIDPQVRVGKLENGLTYYIRHNEEPKGQANFYIAQKVGSIIEAEGQEGLAHFLEHMCFNGTEKFPGNRIVKYCESIGVQFGGDLNAYTSLDETVYNIDKVPLSVEGAVDSCLWILHDWADGLLLLPEEIDKERGVITEEWRSRRDASQRMYEQLLPKVYPDGNPYSNRLPIGLIETIQNFPYQALRDYYEKWYRPDQQGIVVVGDFDVDEMEKKIVSIFSTIAKPVNPAERFYVQVPDNKEPIIAMAKDKEQQYVQSYIFMKHDDIPDEMKNTLNYYITLYAKQVSRRMAAQRLAELAELPEPPFIDAAIMDDDYFISKTKGAFTGIMISNEAGFNTAITTLYREMLRILRHGFTASEYERAKAEYLATVESAYNQRAKTTSASYCSEYVRHFIDNEPIPGIETEYALSQQLAPAITVDVINQYVMSLGQTDSNLVVACMLPDVEGVQYPTEKELEALLKKVEEETIEPYVDKVSNEPLMSEMPQKGSVVKSKESILGYTEYTLSNGAKVYHKETDFNADQILFTAYSKGGISLYDEVEALNLKVTSEVMNVGGLGNFSSTDLTKVLAGKKVSVSMAVNTFSESLSGRATPKDFETLMQLIYLSFTSLRSDEDAFKSWQNKTSALLKNAATDPMTAFNDTLVAKLYGNNPLATQLKLEDVEKIDYARVMEIARERYANAADFSFVFTGNISADSLLPKVEQYIASLPAQKGKEKQGKVLKLNDKPAISVFEREMQQPMATVAYMENNKTKYSLKQDLIYSIAMQVLDIVYTEEIREKDGGTYGVSTSGAIRVNPEKRALLQIVYQTDPSRYEGLNEKIEKILQNFAVEGPSEEDVRKVKDFMIKNHKENLQLNGYFNSAMSEYLATDLNIIDGYEETLESITTEDVRKAVASVLKGKNGIKIVMYNKGE
ncbi:MAG: insulinase family protein [Bacteroidaceae bacterium]|nr:insulinase family protein [Bacteroidaceae bacterium]